MTLLLGVSLYACSADTDTTETDTGARFDEHLKTGDLSLMIVGDYFHHSYVREIRQIARALSPRARQVILCTKQYERALIPLFRSNGVENVEYKTVSSTSPIFKQWARDIAVAATTDGGTSVVVSPNKHATTKADAFATADFLKSALPNYDVVVAPFVFEGGNLAFVHSDGKRILVMGRKVVFDNRIYQRREWASHLDDSALLAAVAETFRVDDVLVVGRATTAPATRMYFEYHLDMGLVVLGGNHAVVSQLTFGTPEREALAEAISADRPVVTPFSQPNDEELLASLSNRLSTVALEYDDYAAVMDSLGVTVKRSPVSWRHVLASMSWTNVVQVGEKLLMPLYPDTLRGITESVTSSDGQLRISLDLTDVGDEQFKLLDFNERNRQLYEDLGYEVIPVPEYLHYMMGGVHCFVNVLE